MKVFRHSRAHGGLVPAEDMSIELIERTNHGELEAIVCIDDDCVAVTRRFGSWGTEPDETGRWRPLLAEYALALQIAARDQ